MGDLSVNSDVTTSIRSSRFKYYIHDETKACRLELIGEFTGPDIEELSGCWRTAKTTLGDRNLVLDVRGLRMSDNQARLWLASMVSEGARLAPESYLEQPGTGHASAQPNSRAAAGMLGRILSAVRGLRVSDAESSTPAP